MIEIDVVKNISLEKLCSMLGWRFSLIGVPVSITHEQGPINLQHGKLCQRDRV